MSESRPLLSLYKFNRIKTIGVELEGGWNERPTAFKVHGDGSVHCEGRCLGESHTTPATTILDVFKDMKVKYPEYVDQSCGMHVHFGMFETDYLNLMDKKFWAHFLKNMEMFAVYLSKEVEANPKNETIKEDYAHFQERLSGTNRFCKREFWPEKQAFCKIKPDTRYTMLNYCYSKSIDADENPAKTVECRLMPMFKNFRLAKMAVVELCNTIESFNQETKVKENFWTTVAVEPEAESIVCEEILI